LINPLVVHASLIFSHPAKKKSRVNHIIMPPHAVVPSIEKKEMRKPNNRPHFDAFAFFSMLSLLLVMMSEEKLSQLYGRKKGEEKERRKKENTFETMLRSLSTSLRYAKRFRNGASRFRPCPTSRCCCLPHDHLHHTSIFLLTLTLIMRLHKPPTPMRRTTAVRRKLPTTVQTAIRAPIRTATETLRGPIKTIASGLFSSNHHRPGRVMPQREDDSLLNTNTRLPRSRHIVVAAVVEVVVDDIAHSWSSTIGQTLLARSASRTALFFFLEDVA
jgi:hypothetical protein